MRRLGSVCLCLLLVVAAMGLSLHPAPINDLFWQVRSGMEILSTKSLPRTETFSWTRANEPWFATEWLYFATMSYAMSAAGGYAGPFLVTLLLGAIICVLLYVSLRRTTREPFSAFLIGFFVISVGNVMFRPRPGMLTIIMIIVAFGLVSEVLCGRRKMVWLWALPAVFAVWANIHQGVFWGLSILGVLGAGVLLEGILTEKGKVASRLPEGIRVKKGVLLMALAAGALATLANPYGAGMYRTVWITIADPTAMSSVAEWRPLRLTWDYLGAVTIIYVGWILAAVLVGVRSKSVPLPWSYIPVVLLAIFMAFKHLRHVQLMAVTCGVLMAPWLELAWLRIRDRILSAEGGGVKLLPKAAGVGMPLALTGLAIWFGLAARAQEEKLPGWGLEKLAAETFLVTKFPVEPLTFMRFVGFPGGMKFYNEYDDGGVFAFYRPMDKTFVDGRNDLFNGAFLAECRNLYRPDHYKRSLNEPAQAFLKSHDFDAVLTSIPAIAEHFDRGPEFELVYVHHVAPLWNPEMRNYWVFVRNRPEYRELIQRSRMAWSQGFGGMEPVISREMGLQK